MTKELTFLHNHEMNDISFTYAYKEARNFKDKSIFIYIGIHKLMKYKEEGYEVMERLLYLASIPPLRVTARGREVRKQNLSITSNPVSLYHK